MLELSNFSHYRWKRVKKAQEKLLANKAVLSYWMREEWKEQKTELTKEKGKKWKKYSSTYHSSTEVILSSMTLKQLVTCTKDRGCQGHALGLMASINLQHGWKHAW